MAVENRFGFPVPPRQLDPTGARLIAPGLNAGDTPTQARLPSIEQMSRLSQKELIDVLQHYGVTKPWEQMRLETSKYLERVSGIQPNSDRWKEEMNSILDHESTAGMRKLTKRVTENWSTLDSIDGNLQHEMMWITVTDDSLCIECEDNGGDIQTYEDWAIQGLPGAAVCLGGDECRCELVPVTD